MLRKRPDELAEAWQSARAQGPCWCARLDASLAHLPATRDRLDDVASG
ncbi:hypothetical protein [Sinisalibacter aestuarii]|nr:hypothetical protein [Sinisalibacter aestuarii]